MNLGTRERGTALAHGAAFVIILGLAVVLFETDIIENFYIAVIVSLGGILAVRGVYALARRGAPDGAAVDAQRDRFLKAVAYLLLAALAIGSLVRLLARHL